MSIVISGGGMIGAILALMLSKLTQGMLEIYLVEKYTPNVQLTENLPYAIALSREAYYTLMEIGMDKILSACSTIIKKIEISESNTIHEVCIDAQDHQLSELGYVIELDVLRKKLFDLLSCQSAISIHCPATLKEIRRERTANVIILSDETKIISKLMVAADGAYSSLATFCGIQRIREDYRQVAVVATVHTEFPHYGCAFEKFTIFGSLAFLPISNNFNYLIWCIASYKKREIATWDKSRFSQELQDIFGWKLGKILDVGPRLFYDLWLVRAKSHISHRLALVGNAAQNIHPIAGQGFNLGLRDVIVLSKIIANALYNNMDIGDYSMLNLYQRDRYLDQCKTIIFTDGLIRLFNNQCIPLVIARNLGLFCFSYSGFLQRVLIKAVSY